MKLTFTDEAKERVARYLGSGKKMLLDFDDGVGPFSKTGSCSLDGGYRLLFVNQQTTVPEFNQLLDSNLGPILIKGESRTQFDDEMEVRFNRQFFTMPLVSSHRTLTDNVEAVDYSGTPLSTS